MKITEFKRIAACDDCGELVSRMHKIKIGNHNEFCLCQNCMEKLYAEIFDACVSMEGDCDESN